VGAASALSCAGCIGSAKEAATMACIDPALRITQGQKWYQEWVNGTNRRNDIATLLDDNVVLFDYDANLKFVGKGAALDHLQQLADDTTSVHFYPNRDIDQFVVGLDHLDWKPKTGMNPHDCVDVFKVDDITGLVTEIHVCVVRNP
jgi:hypothetical protein